MPSYALQKIYQFIFICLHVISVSIHMTAHKQKEH
jgi:hypothetical protein